MHDRFSYDLKQIFKQFVSIGSNCEFGLAQRQAGANPVGLLRFAKFFVPFGERIGQLTASIDARFSGIGAPETVECFVFGDEYMILEHKYALMYHTHRMLGEYDADQLKEDECLRLDFMRQKLLDEFHADKKIFVWKQTFRNTEKEVKLLHEALNRQGASKMLWVVPSESLHSNGSIQDLGNGLFESHITRLAPEEMPGDYDFDGWVDVCCAVSELIFQPAIVSIT